MTSSKAVREERKKRNLKAGLTADGKPRKHKRAKPGGRYSARYKRAKREEAEMTPEMQNYKRRFETLLDNLRTFRQRMPMQSTQQNAQGLDDIIWLAGEQTTEVDTAEGEAASEESDAGS